MKFLLVTTTDNEAQVNAVIMRCLRLMDRAVALMLRAEAIETVEVWLSGGQPQQSASDAAQQLRGVLNVLGEATAQHAQRTEIIDHVKWWAEKMRTDLELATS